MIKWKSIGKVLIAVLNGKTVTISDPVQSEKIKEQIKEYNENPEPEKFQEIELEVNAEKNEEIRVVKEEISKKEIEAAKLEEEVKKTEKTRTRAKKAEKVLEEGINSEYFIKTENGNLQLKGYPYDIPKPLAVEFAEREVDGKPFDHLINFWKLLLLTTNDQARQDAFKYLTKQGMTITKQGYFLTFRRVHLKKDYNVDDIKAPVFTIPASLLDEFATKVKKWKGSQKGYFIVETEDSANKYKLVRKDKLKAGDKNLGSLFSFTTNEGGATVLNDGDEVKKVRHIYTDNRTKKFEIEIGVPVQMDRKDTDQNHKVECSYGLHVGTPSYVKDNSWLGEKILACLVNPMHIVSVPYNDAHKMRVCEYLPIKEITLDEMNAFKDSDLSEFEYAYMAYESIEMEKQLAKVKGQINIIDEGLFTNFTKYQSVADLEKLEAKIKELKESASELKINTDPISKQLDLKHIESIIAARRISAQ